MKKLFSMMAVAMMALFMVSCSGGDGPGAKATEFFNSIKDQLATMPKDELKAKALEFGEIIKPVMQKSVEVVSKLFRDDNFSMEDAAKAYEEAGLTADDVQTVQNLVEDFTAEAQKNPEWGSLQLDSDFSKQWTEAMGMGDLMNDIDSAVDSATEAAEGAEEAVEAAAKEVTEAVEDAVTE